MTDAAYGLPTELPAYLRPQRPYIRGTPLTARFDECSITPLEAPGAPKLIFVRGALRGHEEGSVPFRLHIQIALLWDLMPSCFGYECFSVFNFDWLFLFMRMYCLSSLAAYDHHFGSST